MSISAVPPSVSATPPRVRLDYLDGLRALMALWVVLGHVAGWVGYRPGLRYWFVDLLLKNHFPVDVFIVLSGFCLTLPVARTGQVQGGGAVFFKSRIRRILPPYYAALFLCAGLYGLHAHWAHLSAWFPQPALVAHPALGDKKAFLTYLFVLVDLFPQYRLVDGPLWSVACEFKIYFLFPVFLWLLTRYGRLAALAGAAALGYGIMGVWWSSSWPHNHTSCPWYVLLFVIGVCSAQSVFGSADRALSKSVWLSLCVLPLLAFLAVVFSFHIVNGAEQMLFYPILDPLIGVSAAAALALLSGGCRGFPCGPSSVFVLAPPGLYRDILLQHLSDPYARAGGTAPLVPAASLPGGPHPIRHVYAGDRNDPRTFVPLFPGLREAVPDTPQKGNARRGRPRCGPLARALT